MIFSLAQSLTVCTCEAACGSQIPDQLKFTCVGPCKSYTKPHLMGINTALAIRRLQCYFFDKILISQLKQLQVMTSRESLEPHLWLHAWLMAPCLIDSCEILSMFNEARPDWQWCNNDTASCRLWQAWTLTLAGLHGKRDQSTKASQTTAFDKTWRMNKLPRLINKLS